MQRTWLEKRGIVFTPVPTPGDAKGLATVQMCIKGWYLPLFLWHCLGQSNIPRRYWPLFYWHYYIQRRWKHAG